MQGTSLSSCISSNSVPRTWAQAVVSRISDVMRFPKAPGAVPCPFSLNLHPMTVPARNSHRVVLFTPERKRSEPTRLAGMTADAPREALSPGASRRSLAVVTGGAPAFVRAAGLRRPDRWAGRGLTSRPGADRQ